MDNVEDSLLLSLRAYRPRENRESSEDFVTEAFAWLLRQSPEFAQQFIENIFESEGVKDAPNMDPNALNWETQVTLDEKRPDMICHVGDYVLVFEHKIQANSTDDQLSAYKDRAEKIWPGRYFLITITAHQGQYSDLSDRRMLWEDVHRNISEYLDDHKVPSHLQFRFLDFQRLLDFEGVGPSDPVKLSSVFCYRNGIALKKQLKDLFATVRDNNWDLPEGYETYLRDKDGRIGLQFHRKEKKNKWTPGVFAGCMLDGSDHCLGERAGDVVDFRVILDFSSELHDSYPRMEAYKNLRHALRDRLKGNQDWEFYDHLSEAKSPNRWHPIHLERSFVDLIRGAREPEFQRERITSAINEGLAFFNEKGELNDLIDQCDNELGGN